MDVGTLSWPGGLHAEGRFRKQGRKMRLFKNCFTI